MGLGGSIGSQTFFFFTAGAPVTVPSESPLELELAASDPNAAMPVCEPSALLAASELLAAASAAISACTLRP